MSVEVDPEAEQDQRARSELSYVPETPQPEDRWRADAPTPPNPRVKLDVGDGSNWTTYRQPLSSVSSGATESSAETTPSANDDDLKPFALDDRAKLLRHSLQPVAESSASSSLSSEAADVKPPKVELTETSLSLSTSNLSSVDNEDEKKEIKFRIKREPTPAYRQHAPSPSPFFDPRPEVQFKRREEENFRLEGGRPKINEEEEWRPKQRPLGPNGAAGASNSEAVEDSGVRRSEAPRPDTPEVKEEEEPPLFSPAPMFDEEDEEDEEEEEDGTPVPETGRREPFARGSEREESDGSEWEREKEPERGHSCEGENRGAYEDEEDDTHGAARPALAWITSYSSRMARNSKKKEVPSRPEPPPPTAVRPIAAKRPLFKKTGHDSSFLPEDLVPRQDFAVRPLHEAAETADSFLDQFFGFASDVPWTAADKMEITGYREAVQVDDDDDDDEAGDGQAPVLPPPETQAEWVKWWFERELLEINQWDQIEMPTSSD